MVFFACRGFVGRALDAIQGGGFAMCIPTKRSGCLQVRSCRERNTQPRWTAWALKNAWRQVFKKG